MSHVMILSGSPSQTSRLAGLLRSVQAALVGEGYDVDWVNVRDLPAEDLVYARADSREIMATRARLERAEAVVVGTPVYKASYTGLLKAYLDLLPEKSLSGKVVLPIAIAGTTAHLLALEYALKPVLSVLGASECLQGVFALEHQVMRNLGGDVEVQPDIEKRLAEAVQELSLAIRRRHVTLERDARGGLV